MLDPRPVLLGEVRTAGVPGWHWQGTAVGKLTAPCDVHLSLESCVALGGGVVSYSLFLSC